MMEEEPGGQDCPGTSRPFRHSAEGGCAQPSEDWHTPRPTLQATEVAAGLWASSQGQALHGAHRTTS